MNLYRTILPKMLLANLVFTVLHSNPVSAQNGQDSRGAIGVKVGYDGGPNGISYNRQLGKALGIDCTLGYNDKQGRRLDVPITQKGNTMLAVNLTPYFMKRKATTTANFYGSFGLGARFHHYRFNPESARTASSPSPVTIDKRAGLGLLITPIRAVEAFLEVHVKHYNTAQNYGAFGTESGLGVRISLGQAGNNNLAAKDNRKAKKQSPRVVQPPHAHGQLLDGPNTGSSF